MRDADLTEIHWSDVRERVAKYDPELAAIIDEIKPGTKYPLYLACYPYGSEVLKNGVLQLPTPSGEIVSIHSDKIKKSTRNALDYNFSSNPAGMILNGSSEIFMELNNRIIQLYGLIPPGQIFGTWTIFNRTESYHPIFTWQMTAGVRSLFMLPKISRTVAHHKLRRALQIQADVPKSLLEHWHVFKEIDQQIADNKPWTLEILFFSKPWFQSLHETKWLKFNSYLFSKAWQGSDLWRNQFFWDMVFSAIQERKNIRHDPYFISTIKQLFTIAAGTTFGFSPAIDDSAAPISKIQKVYKEIYELDYAPIIMQPGLFLPKSQSPRSIYYSLEFPTILDSALKSRGFASKITDLNHIHYVLGKIRDEILHGKLNLEQTIIFNVAKTIQFDFFHSDVSNYPQIRSSKDIPVEDNSFLAELSAKKGNNFPDNCPFVRGCIRISKSKDKIRA